MHGGPLPVISYNRDITPMSYVPAMRIFTLPAIQGIKDATDVQKKLG